ncbi:MAG: hypothetical protein AMJ92_06270 [candidate division Zixibacteria bacterium SM23_81]|nr:MAG: hypothetical protein AMJ92_06270 [candidate division Zixibacteria bacterium SM23_81]
MIVGYLEGTDGQLLTNLVVEGVDTLPLSNGWDGHGKTLGHITPSDNISLIVGYLHKVFHRGQDVTAKDVLYNCILHKLPIMLMVPECNWDAAREILGEVQDDVTLVDPENVLPEILKKLGKDPSCAT